MATDWRAVHRAEQARQRDLDRQRKAATRYGVFKWTDRASGPPSHDGGYVVREIHNGIAPAPYNSHRPVRVFTQRHHAQAYANKLNG